IEEFAQTHEHFVSIHAPTRGATVLVYLVAQTGLVSIHAPTRGATNPELDRYHYRAFQSTRPRGARLRMRN
ncbi:MAG: hypothetical protein NTV00_06110, partial [Methylococcales bacterium]|nr:hypothetical protein [Methylococcales bacterium]